MSYYFSKVIGLSFNEAVKKVSEKLKEKGFGILTQIDLKEKFKEKLNKDFNDYVILGACNPSLAYEALQIENKVGLMLPCNVIVQKRPDSKIEIAIIDPVASMQAIDNPALKALALKVQEKLKACIENLENT